MLAILCFIGGFLAGIVLSFIVMMLVLVNGEAHYDMSEMPDESTKNRN